MWFLKINVCLGSELRAIAGQIICGSSQLQADNINSRASPPRPPALPRPGAYGHACRQAGGPEAERLSGLMPSCQRSSLLSSRSSACRAMASQGGFQASKTKKKSCTPPGSGCWRLVFSGADAARRQNHLPISSFCRPSFILAPISRFVAGCFG